MQTVVIVIHLMVIVALVAVVLLQRSEGGALGMGGGDQFMTMRGQGNVLTRATTILAAIFFATSLAMSVLNRLNTPPTAVLDTAPAAQTAPAVPPTPGTAPATGTGTSGSGGILDQLNKYTSGPPAAVTPKSVVPDTNAPAAPAGSQAPNSQ
jgi:preprotein translocase subunit SecG